MNEKLASSPRLEMTDLKDADSNRKLGVCGARRLKIDAIMRG